MKTISSHVQEYMRIRPFLSKYLYAGVINYRALARRIQPIIQQQIGEHVSTESVAISLQRLASSDNPNPNPIGILEGLRIVSHLHILNYEDGAPGDSIVQSLMSHADDHVMYLPAPSEATLVVSDSLYQATPVPEPTTHYTAVSALGIKQATGVTAHEAIGRLYYPLAVLADNGITVLLTSSTLHYQYIYVADDQVDTAVRLLRTSLAR